MPATVPMPNIFINIPLYGITTVVDSANCLVLVEVAAESKNDTSSNIDTAATTACFGLHTHTQTLQAQ